MSVHDVTLNMFINSLYNQYNWNNQNFFDINRNYSDRYQYNRLLYASLNERREIIVSNDDKVYYKEKNEKIQNECNKTKCYNIECKHWKEILLNWLIVYPCENNLPAESIAFNGKLQFPIRKTCTNNQCGFDMDKEHKFKDCLLCRKFYCVTCRSLNPKLCNTCYMVHPTFGEEIRNQKQKEDKNIDTQSTTNSNNSYKVKKKNRTKTVIVLGTTLEKRTKF